MTEVPLKEFIESRLASVEHAIAKSERLLEVRLATMNEFRESLRDQASRMATKEQVDSEIKQLERRLQILERYKSYLLGWSAAAAATVAFIISIATRFFPP